MDTCDSISFRHTLANSIQMPCSFLNDVTLPLHQGAIPIYMLCQNSILSCMTLEMHGFTSMPVLCFLPGTSFLSPLSRRSLVFRALLAPPFPYTVCCIPCGVNRVIVTIWVTTDDFSVLISFVLIFHELLCRYRTSYIVNDDLPE